MAESVGAFSLFFLDRDRKLESLFQALKLNLEGLNMPVVPATGIKRPVECRCATLQQGVCLSMWDSHGRKTLACRLGKRRVEDAKGKGVGRRGKKARAAGMRRSIQISVAPSVPLLMVPIDAQCDRQFVKILWRLVPRGIAPGAHVDALYLVNPTKAMFSLLRNKSVISMSSEK